MIENLEVLNSILDKMNEYYLLVDPRNYIVHSQSKLKKLIKKKVEKIFDLFDQDGHEALKNNINISRTIKRTIEFENYLLLDDKQHKVFCHFKIFPLVDTNINDDQIVILINRIDDKKFLIDKNDVLAEHLRQMITLTPIRNLISGVGHEINNILTVIWGSHRKMMGLFNTLTNEKNQAEKYHIRIENQIKRISEILEGLALYSQVKSEYRELIDVHRLIDLIMKLIKGIYLEDKIVLEKKLDAIEFLIGGQAATIFQVFMYMICLCRYKLNLVNGGTINIKTFNHDDKMMISFSCSKDRKNHNIFNNVNNDIEMEFLEILKEQSGMLKTEKSESILIFPYLESHRIKDEGKVDKKRNSKKVEFANRHALIIENNSDVAYVIENYLVDMKIKVDMVNNIKDSLSLITKNKYDLVIVDQSLPDGLGHEFIMKSKILLKYEPKFILMSGRTEKELQKEIKKADAHLKKPFNEVQVADTLRQVLT